MKSAIALTLAMTLASFGYSAAPPVKSPASIPDGVDDPPLFGVESDKLKGGDGTRYTVNGVPVPRATAYESLPEPAGAPDLPDPRGKIAVTVIGSDADRAAVLRDLASVPALQRFRDRLVIRDYRPDHWHVADVGFKGDGKPTIYLQDDTGTVLHRQDEYRGPDALVSALRKVDPQYDPTKDPDANKSAIPSLADLLAYASRIPPVVWIVGAVALFLLTKKDK